MDRPIDGALRRVLERLRSKGLPQWFVGYRMVEFAANIFLYLPFGMILALRLHRRLWWLAVVIAGAASCTVELAKGIFLPDRVPAYCDIIANSSGAFIGAILVLFLWSVPERRAHRVGRRKA